MTTNNQTNHDTGTQELRHALGWCIYTPAGEQCKHLPANQDDDEETIAKLEALINTRIVAVLDRVEKEVLSDDGTNTMFTEWNGMRIADLDVQRQKLKALRKELS